MFYTNFFYVDLQFQRKAKAYGKQLYIEHYRDFRREQDFTNSQKLKSRKPEEGLFYFEIDGMDQSKTLLPHYVNAPKNINKDILFDFHITVVK